MHSNQIYDILMLIYMHIINTIYKCKIYLQIITNAMCIIYSYTMYIY